MNSKELMLGLILVKESSLTRDQLKRALLKQGEIRRFGRYQRLGEVIVKMGFMTQDEIETIISMQNTLLAHGADHTPLGLLLIEHGLASPSQVYDALVERQFSEVRLGELLVEKGVVTEAQLLPLITQQNQERAAAREARLAAGEPADAPRIVKIDDFVVFDAGGDETEPVEAQGSVAADDGVSREFNSTSYLGG